MLDTSTQEVCVGSYHLDREVQRTRCLEAVFRAKGALLNSPQRMNHRTPSMFYAHKPVIVLRARVLEHYTSTRTLCIDDNQRITVL